MELWMIVAVAVIYGWIGGGIFGAVAWNEKGQAWKPRWLWVAVFFSTWVWPFDVVLMVWGMVSAWRLHKRMTDTSQEAYEDRVEESRKRIESFDGVEHVETMDEVRARIQKEAEEIDRAKKKGVH